MGAPVSSGSVWVDEYTTRDGVHVSGNWRTRTAPTSQAPDAGDDRSQPTSAVSTAPPEADSSQPTNDAERGSSGIRLPDEAKIAVGMAELRRMRQHADTQQATADSADTQTVERRCRVCGRYISADGAHVCPGPPTITAPTGLGEANYADVTGAERTQAMLADLEGSVQKVMESGQLEPWLDAMAANGLTRWSTNNRMLAIGQMLARGHDGTGLHMMGFRQWEKYDRTVVKGAKAIYILAPITKKHVSEDDDGNTVENYRTIGFKGVPVFDVSDTHGAPLPELPATPPAGRATAGTLAGLRERVGRSGYTYTETQIPDCQPESGRGTLGYTDPAGKNIVVDQRLSEAQKASTIAHELGHVHCGHVDGNYADYRAHRGRYETEAEMTAYLVNRSRGMPRAQAESFSPAYIATWSRGNPNMMRTAMDTAITASTTILDGQWPAT